MAYTTDVEPGDVLQIGETRITVLQKKGQKTKLRVDSHDHVVKSRVASAVSPSGIVRPPLIGAGEEPAIARPR
jgi:hypothetical protein